MNLHYTTKPWATYKTDRVCWSRVRMEHTLLLKKVWQCCQQTLTARILTEIYSRRRTRRCTTKSRTLISLWRHIRVQWTRPPAIMAITSLSNPWARSSTCPLWKKTGQSKTLARILESLTTCARTQKCKRKTTSASLEAKPSQFCKVQTSSIEQLEFSLTH